MMNRINNNELMNIVGGALSGSILNAIYDIYDFIFNLGRKLGSSFRREEENEYCSIN